MRSFKKCNSLTSIEIPDQVKKIRSYAFENCREPVEITLPESITEIESNAISECPKLKRIFVGKDSYAENWLKDNGFEELIQYK